MFRITKRQKGFGLIEALIASGIIVGIASASVGLSTKILRATTEFDEKIVADNLAAKQIEALHWYRLNELNNNRQWTLDFPTPNCSGLSAISICSFSIFSNNISPPQQGSFNETLNGIDYQSYFTVQKDPTGNDIYHITANVIKDDNGTDIVVSEIKTEMSNWRTK